MIIIKVEYSISLNRLDNIYEHFAQKDASNNITREADRVDVDRYARHLLINGKKIVTPSDKSLHSRVLDILLSEPCPDPAEETEEYIASLRPHTRFMNQIISGAYFPTARTNDVFQADQKTHKKGFIRMGGTSASTLSFNNITPSSFRLNIQQKFNQSYYNPKLGDDPDINTHEVSLNGNYVVDRNRGILTASVEHTVPDEYAEAYVQYFNQYLPNETYLRTLWNGNESYDAGPGLDHISVTSSRPLNMTIIQPLSSCKQKRLLPEPIRYREFEALKTVESWAALRQGIFDIFIKEIVERGHNPFDAMAHISYKYLIDLYFLADIQACKMSPQSSIMVIRDDLYVLRQSVANLLHPDIHLENLNISNPTFDPKIERAKLFCDSLKENCHGNTRSKHLSSLLQLRRDVIANKNNAIGVFNAIRSDLNDTITQSSPHVGWMLPTFMVGKGAKGIYQATYDQNVGEASMMRVLDVLQDRLAHSTSSKHYGAYVECMKKFHQQLSLTQPAEIQGAGSGQSRSHQGDVGPGAGVGAGL